MSVIKVESRLPGGIQLPTMARVMNLVFLLIVIFGTAIAVILTVVLSISNSKSENPAKRPVMFYALYRGNETGLPVKSATVLLLADEKSSCSLEQNVDNARNSIHSMQDQDIRFSIILYDDSATSTSHLTASEAIAKLKEVKTSSSRNVSQTSAIKEFKKQTGTGRSDAFIFFTPCKIHPGDEEDRKNFVHYMEDVQEKTVIVCTAMPAEELKKRYGNTTNVVSEEDKDNIGAKIADFGHNITQLTWTTAAYTSTTLGTQAGEWTTQSPSSVSEVSTESTSPSTVSEVSAESTSPASVSEVSTESTSPSTVSEVSAESTSAASVSEVSTESTSPSTVSEVSAESPNPSIVLEAA